MSAVHARRLTCLVIALVAGLFAAACSSDSVTNANAPFALALSLSPDTDTIFVSDTLTSRDTVRPTLSAKSLNSPVQTPGGVEWTSDDSSVVRVDPDGTVHAVGLGSTTVTARINSARATATIVVTYRAVRLTVTPPTLTGLVNDTVLVTAAALDAAGASVPGTAYSFRLSDPAAATVTPAGNGTARLVFRRSGSIQITVTGGGRTGTATGTIQPEEFIASPASDAPAGSLVLSAGEDVSCGILPLGRGYCFGHGPLLGVAKDTVCFDDTTSEPSPCTLAPLRIAGQLNLTAVSVGDSVACGTASGNRVYCWGWQTYGQLGNGVAGAGSSTSPKLVVSPSSQTPLPLNRVSAGENHACGLTPGNAAWCWGKDSAYQLGNGEQFSVNSSTPIPVAGANSFATISAGRNHTCAISTDKRAFCWGDNALGQLGTGAFGDSVDTPAPIAGAAAFASISAGGFHTCALTTAGTAWCWGANDDGQLGRGFATVNPATPAPIAGGLTFRSISAGRLSTCAITTAGVAYCWGRNYYGQLGDGTRETRDLPTAVAGGITGFNAVTVGTRHACAVGTGGAYCWGSNVFGALGNGLQALIQAVPTKTITPQ